MAIRIVRLGTPRAPTEGPRLGAGRRPPPGGAPAARGGRGFPRAHAARRDFYDVWLPNLAPSDALLKAGRAAVTPAARHRLRQRYRAETRRARPRRGRALPA